MKPLIKKFDVGVVIGRFQVDDLHEAHTELLTYVRDNHDEVIVMIGIPAMNYGSENNPLDYNCRSQMIREKFPSFITLPIIDLPCDYQWSKILDYTIRNIIGPRKTVQLYGSRDSFIGHYKGRFSCQELECENNSKISGTEIRRRIQNSVIPNAAFRAGAIWQTYNRYPACFPTVDVAIHDKNKNLFLMGKKPSEEQWRFVGGFAEANSASYERDALREVQEETGLEVSYPKYIGSTIVDDWRLRKEKDKIKTLFFYSEYLFGSPKANDDICEVAWVDILNNKDIVIDTHKNLLDMLIKFINEKNS